MAVHGIIEFHKTNGAVALERPAPSIEGIAPMRPKSNQLPCGVESCDRPATSRGYCAVHYNRLYRYGDLRPNDPIRKVVHGTVEERFWAYTEKTEDCWIWHGTRDGNGYGQLTMKDGPYRRKMVGAHRLSYEINVGPIPEGLVLDHLCRNPGCVNPEHLEPVTFQENIRRGKRPVIRRPRKTHCKRGHEFTPENTYITKQGHQRCRACKRLHERQRRQRGYS